MALHQEMDVKIKYQSEKYHGILKIGASTTASEYVLPYYLANFKKKYPNIYIQLKTDNTEEIERLLIQNKIDIAVVEGKSKRSSLEYTPFKKDEIVLCTSIHTTSPSVFENVFEIQNLPIILREKGSGTLEIINNALIENGLIIDKLSTEIVLENNESIKNYLQNSNTYAFLSISAIQNELIENKLKIIDINNFAIHRLYYIVKKKESQNTLATHLIRHLLNN